MAGIDLQLSNVVMIATVIAVVVGLVIAFMWYFKRSENLTDEDRLNIERVKVLWLGAIALGALTIVATNKEKSSWKRTGGAKKSATLL